MKKLRRVAIGGNSTDRALLQLVENAAQLPLCKKGFTKPFNSKDKLAITAVSGEFQKVLVKGAPEILLPACRYALDENCVPKNFSASTIKVRRASTARQVKPLPAMFSIVFGPTVGKSYRRS